MNHIFSNNKGLTLIEMTIAIAIASIITSGAYMTYLAQAKTNVTQQKIVDMHQNLRAALDLMERDIRMAGYDATDLAGSSILLADSAELQFTMDDNEDGTIDPLIENEMISYGLIFDGNRNGLCEVEFCHLGRGSINQVLGDFDVTRLAVAGEYIDAINFVYLDTAGDLIETPVQKPNEIATIQVTIVARTGRNVPVLMNKYQDRNTYLNLQGEVILPAQNDNFRRFVVSKNIRLRNINYN